MTYPVTQPATPPTKPKGMLITGIVLVVLAIVVFLGGSIWGTVLLITTARDSPVFQSPGEATAYLDAGDHALWTNSTLLFADDVTITGPNGEVTPNDYDATGNTSLTRDGTSFSPEVTFVAPTTGSYTVEVDESGPSTKVLVGPPASVLRTSFALFVVGFVLAAIMGITGLILFIVGLVKRGKAKRPQGPPPGAYGSYGQPPGYDLYPGYGQQPGYGQPPPAAPGR